LQPPAHVAEHKRLQLDQDIDLQRREWRVQRVGWYGLATFVLAALLGVFGKGPLSHAAAGASGLSVEYERFVRAGAPSRLTIEIPPAPGGTLPQLSISRDYVDAMTITHILPSPAASELRAGDALFSFERGDTARSPFTVEIEVEPRGMGRPTATVRSGDAAVTFSQLAYP
jgi:hypothetical protein